MDYIEESYLYNQKIIEENELLLNESLSEDKKERVNCIKIIRTNLNKWLKSYWKK